MLTAKEFVTHWEKDDEPLVQFPKESVERLALSDADKEFLVEAGLPKAAAPFLSFDIPTSGELPTVAERWRQADEFRRYRSIGSDGSGNPIALDLDQQGEVV